MTRVAIASVTGESHIRQGKGNEDSFFVGRGPGGWLAVVVADGCGSSKHAANGAKITAELVGDALLRIAKKIITQGEGEWIIDDVIVELANIRAALRRKFGPDITDYSATIVSVLHSPRGGFFLHIGDGQGISFSADEQSSTTIGLQETANSPPDHGEYINQTFYLTEPNWIKHCRITPIPRGDAIFLMSDGAQEVVAPRAKLDDKIASAILGSIAKSQEDSNVQIRELLQSPDAKAASGDDKTLAVILTDNLSSSSFTILARDSTVRDPENESGELRTPITKPSSRNNCGALLEKHITPKQHISISRRTYLHMTVLLAGIVIGGSITALWMRNSEADIEVAEGLSKVKEEELDRIMISLPPNASGGTSITPNSWYLDTLQE